MTNRKYWIRRAAELEKLIQDNAAPTAERIKQAYVRAIENINADMQKILRELSKVSEISEKQAKKLISAAQNNELYRDLLRLYNETEDERTRMAAAKKINARAYGARISRLEALKEKAYTELKKAQNTEMSLHKALHEETIQRSYYSNIYNIAKGLDAGVSFSVLPKKAISNMLSKPWLGSNYSKRIWNNNEQFISKVQETIESGIIGGHSINRMSEELLEYVNTEGKGQRYIAERLVRTETAHFMSEGQLESYREIGIEKYRYVAALSERTCDTCGGLDGEVFDVSEARAGDNYPPMHANCRCTTIMADAAPNTRNARNPETGENYKVDGNMTFNEWKNSLTDEQRKVMETHVRQMKNASSDRRQYEKYISVIGKENMPKSFDKWQDLKYNDSRQWELLKDYKHSRSSNMISAFTSFGDYKEYKQKINDELIGLTTVDGVKIKGQSKHFIERVFGTSQDPNTGRARNGVEIDDIKDALANATKIIDKGNNVNYRNSVCSVSVNPKTGVLIQTNPKNTR